MKNVNLAVRTALSEKLNGSITYLTKNIATFEEYLQETSSRKKAILSIGNMQVEAYIILLNQTSNDASSKCVRNDQVSIQVQITTVWPANKGGSKTSEEISEIVLGLLFTEDGLFTDLVLPEPFQLWKGELGEIRNINFDTTSNRTWITNLFLIFEVNQS